MAAFGTFTKALSAFTPPELSGLVGINPYQRDDRCTVGACQGGAVWFGTVTPDDVLVVGEGIETTLSAMILWGAKAGAATLGTAGLRSLVLPQAARRVVIAADNDAPVYKDSRSCPMEWMRREPHVACGWMKILQSRWKSSWLPRPKKASTAATGMMF